MADLHEALGELADRKVWAMHVPALSALATGGTQWRTRLIWTERGPVERVVGLDYGALKVALDMVQICMTPAQWADLMVMERAAAGALNGDPAPTLELH